MVPADNWDLDATHESMLLDLVIGGVERKVLVETSKIGWGIVLDRVTGQFLGAFRTGYDNLITGWTDIGWCQSTTRRSSPPWTDVDSGRVFEVGLPVLRRHAQPELASYSPVTGLYYVGNQQQLHGFSRTSPRSTGRAGDMAGLPRG